MFLLLTSARQVLDEYIFAEWMMLSTGDALQDIHKENSRKFLIV